MKDRMSLRLGSLAEPLEAWCNKHNASPSQAVRLAVAKMLKAKPPEMPEGNPCAAKQRKDTQ